MSILKRIIIYVLFYLLVILFASCQPIQVKKVPQTYLEFNEAISQLSSGLMTKLQQRKDSLNGVTTIIFNPFIDIGNGQVLQVSQDIETKFFEVVRKNFKQFKISRITLANLADAQYILNGFIKYEASKTQKAIKRYQVSASIVDLTTKTIVTKGTYWVASKKLNYQPLPSYEDNPLYNAKSSMSKYIVNAVENEVGSQIDDSYFVLNETKALLIEAQTAYDKYNYKQARTLYIKVLQQPGGKMVETYGGLYMTNFKLGKITEAAKSFRNMIRISMKTGSLPVKLLFQSDLTDFLNIKELRQQYILWLKQIGLYLKNHPDICVNIIGHTSKYGIDKFNKRLSKQRADVIQQKIRKTFRKIIKKSKTVGMGSKQTIVGTAPDSIDNAIDRRVEFKIVNCLTLSSSSVLVE